MSKNYEQDGANASLELGKDGGRIKSSAGVLQARNNADDALVTMEVADGTTASHAATKGQLDSLDSGLMKNRTVSLAFGTSSPLNIGATLPANSVVTKVSVNVGTIFNGTAPTLEIGVSGDTDVLQTTAENDLTKVDLYPTDSYYDVGGSATQIIATYVADGSSAGAAEITIQYFTP